MYAVIQTVASSTAWPRGDIVRVELLDKEPKETIAFDRVLLVEKDGQLSVGKPTVAGAQVTAEVLVHDRHKKVIIYKKKRTTTYQRTQGHRQGFTEVRITGIQA